jgi:hypothetical protein
MSIRTVMLNSKKILMSVVIGMALSSGTSFAGPSEVKDCLREAIAKPNPVFQVADAPSPVERFSRYLVMICNGESAKNLYESLNEAAVPGEWAGKTRGEFKYLGEDGGASMCYHVNTDSKGEIVNEYNCSIRLTIASKNLGKTKDSEMEPFILKKFEAPKPVPVKVGF